MDLDACLQELERQGGSDLHLKAGRPPLMRIRGDLLPTDVYGDDLMIGVSAQIDGYVSSHRSGAQYYYFTHIFFLFRVP